MIDAWLGGIGFILLSIGVPATAVCLTWPNQGPEESDANRAERLLIALAVPVAVLIVASEELAHLGRLQTPLIWVYAAVATSVALALVVRNQALARERLHQWRAPKEIAARLVAAVTLVGAGSIEMLLAIRRPDSFTAPTSWYYWQLSTAISRHGAVPRLAQEWGTTVPFFDYHLGFNAMGATLGLATGEPHALVAAQLIRILTVLGTVLGVVLLTRVLGASRSASLAAGIAVPCVAILNIKLSSFRPESTAYFLMLAPPAILYCWLGSRGRLRLGALVVSFIGVSQLHTPVAVVSLVLCVAIALVKLRWSWRAVGALTGAIALMFAAWFVVDAVTGHRGPFSDTFADPPELTRSGADPTYAFNQLATGAVATSVDEIGHNPPSSSHLLRQTMGKGFVVGEQTSYRIAMALLALVAVVGLFRRRWEAVRLVLAVGIAVGGMIAAAYITSLSWKTYIPLRTGYARLLQIWWFGPLVVIPVLPSLFRNSRARQATTALILGLTVTLWWFSVDPTRAQRERQPSQATLRSLRALDLAPGGTVLTNTYTQGFIRYNLRANGLLDGRAPYLEARLLVRSNRILVATGQYMREPALHPFPFTKYDVKYVLAGTAPSALGNPIAFPTDIGKLRLDTNLKVVREGPGYTLFRVVAATQ